MTNFSFAACETVFTHRCCGEVVNLLRAAERYGFLIEESRERIEVICGSCRNREPAQGKGKPGTPGRK